MTEKTNELCPRCGRTELNHPFVALSRTDNLTSICPQCGECEALEFPLSGHPMRGQEYWPLVEEPVVERFVLKSMRMVDEFMQEQLEKSKKDDVDNEE